MKKGLRPLLLRLYKTRKEREKAKAACRVLFELNKKNPSRPKYPKFSCDSLPHFAENFGSSGQ